MFIFRGLFRMRPRALRSQQPTLTAPLWFPVGAARLPVLGQGSAAPHRSAATAHQWTYAICPTGTASTPWKENISRELFRHGRTLVCFVPIPKVLLEKNHTKSGKGWMAKGKISIKKAKWSAWKWEGHTGNDSNLP